MSIQTRRLLPRLIFAGAKLLLLGGINKKLPLKKVDSYAAVILS